MIEAPAWNYHDNQVSPDPYSDNCLHYHTRVDWLCTFPSNAFQSYAEINADGRQQYFGPDSRCIEGNFQFEDSPYLPKEGGTCVQTRVFNFPFP